MGKSQSVPLASGLVTGEADPIYGQMEISLTNSRNINIMIKRKPYSGHSDLKFTIPTTSLESFIDILFEAKEKLDEIWFSKVATSELEAAKKFQTRQR